MSKSDKPLRKNIDITVSKSRILRQIAIDKGFESSKQFIEHLCDREITLYQKKQQSLFDNPKK